MKLIKAIGILFILFGLVCSSIGIGLLDQTSVQAGASLSQLDASSWSYRQQITIKGSPDGALTNYQMKLTVHKGSGTSTGSNVYLSGHCKDDFSDIRFTKADGTTLLDYWIENFSNGNISTVWVELDSIPANQSSTGFYIYYGNRHALSASNGFTTFKKFDDFQDGDYIGWTVVQGTWSAANHYLEATSSGVPDEIDLLADLTTYRIRARISNVDANIVGVENGSRSASYQIYTRYSGVLALYYNGKATPIIYSNWISDSNSHVIEMTRDANSLHHLYFDNVLKGSEANDLNTAFDRLAFESHGLHGTGQRLYWIFAANFTAVEPTFGLCGGEEHGPWGSCRSYGVQIGLLSCGVILLLSGAVALLVCKTKRISMRAMGISILAVGAIVVAIAVVMMFV